MESIRSGELHPLENAVVLEIIFEQLSFNDLKACRLVSKLWRDHCIKHWRSSSIMTIEGFNFFKEYFVSMQNFLKFVGNKGSSYFGAPFTKFLLRQQLKKFWPLCGSTIKSLEIQHRCSFKSVNDFREALFFHCPNLKELTFNGQGRHREFWNENDGVRVQEPSEWEEHQFRENKNLKSIKLHNLEGGLRVSWMELFTYYPNLESISLKGSIPNENGLFRSINLIRRRDSTKLKLKNFCKVEALETVRRCPELETFLSDSTLNLETLKIPGKSVSTECNTLVLILSNHASTLKKVAICGRRDYENGEAYDNIYVGYQRQLIKLEELELVDVVFPSLTILAFTPNLKKLVLSGEVTEMIRDTDISEMTSVPLPNCTEISILDAMLEVNSLKKLMAWLPNVEKINIILNNNTFRLVCEGWSNLRSLEITAFQLDDRGITGLDIDDVRKINGDANIEIWMPITVARPNITSLKYLNNVTINGLLEFQSHRSVAFGYCSAACGFLQLPDLENINFSNCEMDENAFKMLNQAG